MKKLICAAGKDSRWWLKGKSKSALRKRC